MAGIICPASLVVSIGVGVAAGLTTKTVTGCAIPDNFTFPVINLSPQEIFGNRIPLLDVNLISPNTYVNVNNDAKVESSAEKLRTTIQKWYVVMRNIVLAGLMIVLLYIGIRILISTTSQEKAKYKEIIKDWFVAMCIVVFLHIFMAVALNVTEFITELLYESTAEQYMAIPLDESQLPDDIKDSEFIYKDEESGTTCLVFKSNFTARARILQQLERTDNGNNVNSYNRVGYTIIYAVLVIYTIMFIVIYLKRLVYMTFLTLIAPLIALTYPIDKLKDGKAQAFILWVKEYMFNLLIQPFHLLIYTVLIGSALDLASENMIYALVAIGFMLPAEKLLRKFFGIENSSTVGNIMSGALGGAALMQGINKITSGKKGKSGGGDKIRENSNPNEERSADTSISDDLAAVARLQQGADTPNEVDDRNQNNIPQNIDTHENPEIWDGDLPWDDDNQHTHEEPRIWDGDLSWDDDEETENNSDNINMADVREQTLPATVDNNDNNDDTQEQAERTIRINPHTIKATKYFGKKAARFAAKGIGATTFGMLGVAAGLASDDYKNVYKYGAAGAVGGTYVGGRMAKVGPAIKGKVESTVDNYRKEVYTKAEYARIKKKMLDDKFMRDNDVKELYKENFQGDYKKAMEAALRYRSSGVTDNDIIIKAMKARGLGDTYDDPRKVIAARYAAQKPDEDKIEKMKERMRESRLDDNNINKIVNQIRIINKM